MFGCLLNLAKVKDMIFCNTSKKLTRKTHRKKKTRETRSLACDDTTKKEEDSIISSYLPKKERKHKSKKNKDNKNSEKIHKKKNRKTEKLKNKNQILNNIGFNNSEFASINSGNDITTKGKLSSKEKKKLLSDFVTKFELSEILENYVNREEFRSFINSETKYEKVKRLISQVGKNNDKKNNFINCNSTCSSDSDVFTDKSVRNSSEITEIFSESDQTEKTFKMVHPNAKYFNENMENSIKNYFKKHNGEKKKRKR